MSISEVRCAEGTGEDVREAWEGLSKLRRRLCGGALREEEVTIGLGMYGLSARIISRLMSEGFLPSCMSRSSICSCSALITAHCLISSSCAALRASDRNLLFSSSLCARESDIICYIMKGIKEILSRRDECATSWEMMIFGLHHFVFSNNKKYGI